MEFRKVLLTGSAIALFATSAHARSFDISGGNLDAALNAYQAQSGIVLMVPNDAVRGVHTDGVKGNVSTDQALIQLLKGTGFAFSRDTSGVVAIVPNGRSSSAADEIFPAQLAQATTPSRAAVETVTVTSSKLGGADVQSIPISITALSQEQLTATQTSGGPDLVKQVPNLTFSKTNFTGYNIQIRGIGTQAVSVTTDPAVAVAFNDIPFIRNHFFEQEFYDVSNVEVLRGPQGTLYGRNATAGVVNLSSARPSDQYEAMASLDVGNYNNRRMEGMLNIPIIGDKLDLRLAGEWTKRDGYAFNEQTNKPMDGRDLWSGRVSLRVRPLENFTVNFVWEHFQEDDDRARSTKQLCTRAVPPSVIDGPGGPQPVVGYEEAYLSLGCAPGPLYGPAAFQTPSAGALPYVVAVELYNVIPGGLNPYADLQQSPNLRVVDSLLDPKYKAKNDTFELNADYNVTDTLTFTSQTGFNKDMLYSTEDYNRFNTTPGLFEDDTTGDNWRPGFVGQDKEFCDPQLGCSSRLVGEDLSQERAQQFSQELRLTSNFSGPFNFSAGANYLHYQTVEDYYVFINVISLYAEIKNLFAGGGIPPDVAHAPFRPEIVNGCNPLPANQAPLDPLSGGGCSYIDPHPLDQIDGQGHNYFRSQNPYSLNSWAGFGEVYYQLLPDLKLTGGLRWTDDRKHFVEIPSWTAFAGKGYPIQGVLDQEWKEWTGRFVANWTPKLDFTDQSLFYGSYSRGYKGGGANPPGVTPLPCFGPTFCFDSPSNKTHPQTFKPEFVDAFELGTKNTLLDGAMTFNADVFYYKYQNYQISQIVDRTSVNLNFNAHVKGAEAEATWEPIPGLRFNLSGGYEDATLDDGSQAIDLIDRTAGHAGWLTVKPWPAGTSNCVLPTDVVYQWGPGLALACLVVYNEGQSTDANNGQGFDKDLSGNKLPNAPPFTLSGGAQYSMPISADWAATARVDGYWQGNTFARVFNDKPYDQIHGYTNMNLSLMLTNQDGWQAMAYMKNVFDTTAITGAFLNTDDTGLTTNVFVTDPRLFGIRITKNW
jgi:outer membrane receptor protein involved in Fe transport